MPESSTATRARLASRTAPAVAAPMRRTPTGHLLAGGQGHQAGGVHPAVGYHGGDGGIATQLVDLAARERRHEPLDGTGEAMLGAETVRALTALRGGRWSTHVVLVDHYVRARVRLR